MRVVFFLQGERVPAARARGLALARWFSARGVSCELRIPHPSVYGDTSLPAALAWPRPLYAVLAMPVRVLQLRGLRDDDVVMFQRPMIEAPTAALEQWICARHPTVFDFDDAIYHNRFCGPKVRPIAAMVDQVVAGNDTLAAAMAMPHKTTVIPTAIDTALRRYREPRAVRGRDVVVGWTGLSSNYPQLAAAADGIARALEATGARFLAIADRPPPRSLTRRLAVEYRAWNPRSEAQDLERIDVGVMPLPDDAYARGKCAYKLLQYMAMGAPGVASPVGMNTDVVSDGVDGYLPRTTEQWTAALVRLIENPAQRAEMGQRARQTVVQRYSQDVLFPRYLEIVSRLAGRALP